MRLSADLVITDKIIQVFGDRKHARLEQTLGKLNNMTGKLVVLYLSNRSPEELIILYLKISFTQNTNEPSQI